MIETSLKIFVLALISGLLLNSSNAMAENRYVLEDCDGFVTSLPNLDRESLSHNIDNHRTELRNQQSNLQVRVAEGSFSKLDAAITIVMPGGLLYAAYKTERQHALKTNLAQVNQDIDQLSSDLLNLASLDNKLVLASLD